METVEISIFAPGDTSYILGNFLICGVLASPWEVALTQRQAQFALKHIALNRLVPGAYVPDYKGFMSPLIQSYKKAGLRTFYRGFPLLTIFNFANTIIVGAVAELNAPSLNVLPLVFAFAVGYSTYPLLTMRNQSVVMQFMPGKKVFPRVLRNGRMFAGVGPFMVATLITATNLYFMKLSGSYFQYGYTLALLAMGTAVGYPLRTISVTQQVLAISQTLTFKDTFKLILRSKGYKGFYAGGLMAIGSYIPVAVSAVIANFIFNRDFNFGGAGPTAEPTAESQEEKMMTWKKIKE